MSDPVFLRHSHGLTVAEIAAMSGLAPLDEALAARRIVDIAALERASPAHLSFLDSEREAAAAALTRAGACFATADLAKRLPGRVAVLVVEEPYRAFVAVARKLFDHALRPSSLYPAGASANAEVHASARLEPDVTIEPGAVVGPNAEIGSGTVIAANATIGGGVRIGRDCRVGAGASVGHALIGDRVVIHPGCRIGQDGFGALADAPGGLRPPQVGRVILQDDVEVGAGTAIDRGAIRDTVIGEGTKIDNLVQVGHNVSIGRHCTIVAQAGIAGGAILEDFVVLGARVGLNDNVLIGEGAHIAASGTVQRDVPAGAREGFGGAAVGGE